MLFAVPPFASHHSFLDQKSLERVSGVSAVKLDFDRRIAIVTNDPDKAQADALTKATQNAGAPSSLRK